MREVRMKHPVQLEANTNNNLQKIKRIQAIFLFNLVIINSYKIKGLELCCFNTGFNNSKGILTEKVPV